MGQSESVSIHGSAYIKAKLNKTSLNLQDIIDSCSHIQQGYHCNAYLLAQLNVVLKVMKKPYMSPMLNEIAILDHLHPIWPNLCEYQIIDKDKLVGFSIKYFEGRKIDLILQDKQNIFNRDAQKRLNLVKKIKTLIIRIQKLNVCHGDIYFDNILISQTDKNSQQCQICIIDFGNGFIFDEKTRTNSGLNGWGFMVPPEARKGKKYDPKGVNAYMLGRIALQVLLLTPYSAYGNSIDIDPTNELNQLSNFGYDQSIRLQIEAYVSENVQARNSVLFRA